MTIQHIGGRSTDRLREVFVAAMEMSPEWRREYVEDCCGLNLSLRDQVFALMRANGRGGLSNGLTASGAERELRPGDRLGAYIVAGLKERFETGETYEAVRSSYPLGESVLVMVIREGWLDEMQIRDLVALDHANLPRVLAAGLTDWDEHYVVLEPSVSRP